MDHLNPYTDMLQYVLCFFFINPPSTPHPLLSPHVRLLLHRKCLRDVNTIYLHFFASLSIDMYIFYWHTLHKLQNSPLQKEQFKWFLACSQVVQPSPIPNSRICSLTQEETPCPLAVTPLFQLQPPAPGNFLSLWICLVWTSFITEIVQLLPKVQQWSLYKVSPCKCFFQEIWFCPSLLQIPQIWIVWWLILCVTLTTPRGTQIFD